MADRSISAFAESITVAELEEDPYPIYARLRREAPVCFIPAVGLWFVTRYDDVEFVGTHPGLYSAQLDDSAGDRTFGSPIIITIDGEFHHELRRALGAKDRPRHVNAYIDGLVRPVAADLLDRLGGRDRAELMADYLEPLSVLGLGSVLGVAQLGAAQLRDWFWRLHQGVINFEGNAEREPVGKACSREIDEVLAPVFDRLGAHGDDSTIAHLLHSGMPAGGCRARDFVMPTLKVILLGGMQEPGHDAASALAGRLSSAAGSSALRVGSTSCSPDSSAPSPAPVWSGWPRPAFARSLISAVLPALGGACMRPCAGVPCSARVPAGGRCAWPGP